MRYEAQYSFETYETYYRDANELMNHAGGKVKINNMKFLAGASTIIISLVLLVTFQNCAQDFNPGSYGGPSKNGPTPNTPNKVDLSSLSISASPGLTVVGGTTVTLTASTSGSSTLTYLWGGLPLLSSHSCATIIPSSTKTCTFTTTNSATTYPISVKACNSEGCGWEEVTVVTIPVIATITASPGLTVKKDEEVTLTVALANGLNPQSFKYKFYKATNTAAISNCDNISQNECKTKMSTITSDTSAHAFVYDSSGTNYLASSDALTLVVVSADVAPTSVAITSDQPSPNVKRGVKVTLTATTTGGTAPFTYEWTGCTTVTETCELDTGNMSEKTYDITVIAKNSAGATAKTTYSIAVQAPIVPTTLSIVPTLVTDEVGLIPDSTTQSPNVVVLKSKKVTLTANSVNDGVDWLPLNYLWKYRSGDQDFTAKTKALTIDTSNMDTGEYTITLVASNLAGILTAGAKLSIIGQPTSGQLFVTPNSFIYQGDPVLFWLHQEESLSESLLFPFISFSYAWTGYSCTGTTENTCSATAIPFLNCNGSTTINNEDFCNLDTSNMAVGTYKINVRVTSIFEILSYSKSTFKDRSSLLSIFPCTPETCDDGGTSD
ncbi:MAG: hypothetical protein A2Z20_08850 [Bdellovibrionales bacterium RBG_16_40_8]|nr:MAG: hypothetical protein A2Z20_08850 [Bdellovibrionales bacterium RBG_16_40_8]